MSETPLLEARSVTKRFPGVLALDSVDFTLRAGEIHALMGENGAGKSTLIKVLTGFYTRDAGEIRLGGEPIDPRTPLAAQRAGISTVYQEVNLIPGLSVAENLFLGRQPKWFPGGPIRWGRLYERAIRAMERLGLGEIDVRRPLASYSVAVQQMVAIARAVDIKARVLVLDEPTSSLDEAEVEQLFGVMRKLKADGLGLIFVTHFMDQVYAVSDRITVLRGGRRVCESATDALPRAMLIGQMIGRDPSAIQRPATARQSAGERPPVILEARGLARRRVIAPFDLTIGRGEIVGLAGLLGSGRTEAARLLFGADAATAGEIRIDGRPAHVRSPRAAIRYRLAFTSEDRKADGILPDLSVRENIVVALQARRGWLRPLGRAAQRRMAQRYIDTLKIRTSDAEKPIKLLSGGNQQKALLARWLATEPRLLILDEPTRGIDVGAKFEIAQLLESLCKDGLAVLLISSEIEELVRSCGRVAVLRDRRFVGELAGESVTEDRIVGLMAEPRPAMA